VRAVASALFVACSVYVAYLSVVAPCPGLLRACLVCLGASVAAVFLLLFVCPLWASLTAVLMEASGE
jgi:hypothetical protein